MALNQRLYQIILDVPGDNHLMVGIPHQLSWDIIRRSYVMEDEIARSRANQEELDLSKMGAPFIEGVDDSYPWSSVTGYDATEWDSQPGPHFHSHFPWARVKAIFRLNPGEPAWNGAMWVANDNVTVGLAQNIFRIWFHGWEGHVNVIANEIMPEYQQLLDRQVAVWRLYDYGGVIDDAGYAAWVAGGAGLLDAVAGAAAADTYLPMNRVAMIQLMMPENISIAPATTTRYDAVREWDPTLDPPPSPAPVTP